MMDPQLNQLILAKAMLPELNNGVREVRQESRGLGRRMAIGLGDLLIAAGRRLQGPQPAVRAAKPQQHPA